VIQRNQLEQISQVVFRNPAFVVSKQATPEEVSQTFVAFSSGRFLEMWT